MEFRLNDEPRFCAGVLCLKNTNFRVFTKLGLWLIFVLSQKQKQLTMQLTINDYSFNSMTARTGFAKVEIFGREVEFIFSDEDAVVAGIELGLIEQPDDSDHTRIGYAKPYFSATVYENVGFEKGIQYIDNQVVLADYEATEYGEQIVSRLAWQQSEVKEVIQANATSICCCDCPPEKINELQLKIWWAANYNIPMDCINWEHVSQHKIASMRIENKLVEKLI